MIFQIWRIAHLLLFSFCFCMLTPDTSYAQNSEYEKWKKEQEAEFKEFQDKFDKEFIVMLEKTWEEVGINPGSDFYKEKKPVTIPKAPPNPTGKNSAPRVESSGDSEVTIDISDITAETIPAPIKIEKPVGKSMFGDIPTNIENFNYFSINIPLEYPKQLQEVFSIREFSNSKIENNKIAEFWDKVSKIQHEPIIDFTNDIKRDLELNDWGYLLLINAISNTIFQGYNNKLLNLYNWFLLTKAGYQIRVGYDQNDVYLLYAVNNNVYNTQYYTMDSQQFYIIDLNGDKQTPSSIFTYNGDHKSQTKRLNFEIRDLPNLRDSKYLITKNLKFSFDNENYTIPLSLDRNLVEYFRYYPLTELPILFASSLSESSRKSIYNVLAPAISGMNEVNAVNLLLRFVQTAFDYKTDQDQFNREKYMTPEETLFYSYSDCDDRAILFTILVKDLLGLEVVGLRYSQHLATAVSFNNESVEGDYHYSDGKKFIVADPTYINATVGLTMPKYSTEKPEIIRLH